MQAGSVQKDSVSRLVVESWGNVERIATHAWLAFLDNCILGVKRIRVCKLSYRLDDQLAWHMLVLQLLLEKLCAKLICHIPLVPIHVAEVLGIVMHCCNSLETCCTRSGQVIPDSG